MKKNWIGIIILIAIIGYGIYDYYGSRGDEKEAAALVDLANVEKGIKKGQLPLDFTLNDLEGNPVSLSDFRGKTIFVNFWATWCPPCRAEMPHMEKIYNEYKDEDVVFLAVNLTQTEKSTEVISQFVKDYGLTFPVVLDEKGDAMVDYEIVAYPTTYVLDKQGIIREKFQGAIDYNIMKKTISKLQ